MPDFPQAIPPVRPTLKGDFRVGFKVAKFEDNLQDINKIKKFSRIQMNTDILRYFLLKFV